MRLGFDLAHAVGYCGPTQRIRVLTKHWVESELYCPSCGAVSLTAHPANNPAADFHCPHCGEEFELKSIEGRFGAKIVNGAYETMMDRLREGRQPNLLLLNYVRDGWQVRGLTAVPKSFFVPHIIERRPPLAATARRAGWIGCKIRLSDIPYAGRIDLIDAGTIIRRSDVVAKWQRILFLQNRKTAERNSWLISVMHCIDAMAKHEFSLQELYAYEDYLQSIFPENKNIHAKIRQQLQVLRDAGFLEFLGRARYCLTYPAY